MQPQSTPEHYGLCYCVFFPTKTESIKLQGFGHDGIPVIYGKFPRALSGVQVNHVPCRRDSPTGITGYIIDVLGLLKRSFCATKSVGYTIYKHKREAFIWKPCIYTGVS